MNNIKQFELDMIDIYREANKIGYKPTVFLRMIGDKGAMETARHLINADVVSSGYAKLWELKRLDLSVEALVVRKWQSLFMADEIEKCKSKLAEYGYKY